MSDSGMRETSEQLTVIPKKFEITRYHRAIYRCSCHSCMKTAPAPAKIVEASSYSNEMILDVALSKYCDLIPVERYAAMAARSGLIDLPPHSLIDLTHKYADFLKPVHQLIKDGILKARVLNADETPHRMLEGNDKKRWYLWGFSTPILCYLEYHDSRSGDVASDVLTLFLTEAEVPIDNNGQEQLLRSHVVGRKTWYGTHSERGAETAAILFTIVETCKLNGVNPREYFKKLTQDLLDGKPAYTPVDFIN